MTNEEHIEQLKKLRSFHNGSYGRSINKAIEVLKQEPSTDAVSRQAVKEQMIKYGFHAPDMTVTEFVEEIPPVTPIQTCEDAVSRQAVLDIFGSKGEFDWVLNCAIEKIKEIPPVTPTRPKGKWIRVTDKAGYLVWECTCCKWQERIATNYCPDCGADMREGEA